jgi:restriction system protein
MDFTINFGAPLSLSPGEFERAVRDLFEAEGVGLSEFQAHHLDKIATPDGTYTFDVTARFQAVGVNFLVIIECKRVTTPIERETVQILHQKQISASAQKSILVSTAPFRFGALEFAKAHGIALILIEDGQLIYEVRSSAARPRQPWLPTFGFRLEHASSGTKYRSARLGPTHFPGGVRPSERNLLKFLTQADFG